MSVTSLLGVSSPTPKPTDADPAVTSKANDKADKSSSSKTSASAEKAKQKEELNQLLQTYKNELQRGQSGSKLQVLAKQIAAAASALGQSVTLPSAPSSTDSAAQGSSSSLVNVTA